MKVEQHKLRYVTHCNVIYLPTLLHAKLMHTIHLYYSEFGLGSGVLMMWCVQVMLAKHSLHPVLVDAASTNQHMAFWGTVTYSASKPVDKLAEYTALCGNHFTATAFVIPFPVLLLV